MCVDTVNSKTLLDQGRKSAFSNSLRIRSVVLESREYGAGTIHNNADFFFWDYLMYLVITILDLPEFAGFFTRAKVVFVIHA